ncbi:MAG TPA: type II toxin-antitoxin system VapC family toxin [Stellaceae bacterium]|nr:type II toxin-antitoxin system VapC family toxin [Stellaceae bacterium]
MIVDASALIAILRDEPEATSTYAPARATGETLLFKGDDFIHTDIAPASEPS